MKPPNPDPNAPFVNGDPAAGIKGSIIPAEMIEYTQREVVNCIQKGGYVPSDTDMFQLTRGVRRALFAFGIDTGSTNSISVALDPPLMAYAQGLEVRVLVASSNTAAVTIRINGLSTQQIVKKDGSTLMAGDLRAGGIAVLVHDGANFQLVSGAAGSTTIADGWFNGADYMVDVGSANHIVGTPAIAPTALAAGQSYLVLVKTANLSTINSGAVDINVNALGVKPLVLPTGQPLMAYDIIANMLIRVSYDGSKFTMLSPIDMAIIEAAVTKVVGPQAGADFADLHIASAWLSRRRIEKAGALTLALQGQAGTALVHNYSADVIIAHPDGDRLTIQGSGMNSVPTNSSFVGGGSVPADAATNVAMLRAAFQTELRFAAGKQLRLQGRVGMIRNFMVAGPSMSSAAGAGGINVTGYVNYDTVASVLSCSTCFNISPNATLSGSNLYAVGSYIFAVGLAHSSNLLNGGGYFVIAQTTSDGIQAAHGAIIQISANQPRITSCSGWGINHWGASSVHMQGSLIQFCGTGGVLTTSATSWLYGSNVSSCGQGFVASIGAQMDCDTCTTNSNTSGDFTCSHGAYMYAAAFQSPSAQFSPSRNTFGNGGAYIEA